LIAIVDAGPLFAAADTTEPDHERCIEVLSRGDVDLVIPSLVVAEVTYLIGTRIGPAAEARFLNGLASLEVEAPQPDDWIRIADLVDKYADFPLGGTDASVIALAERLGTPTVITLDRRHFGTVRPKHCESLTLLP
jgi:predicted nucleic acid-binding protein